MPLDAAAREQIEQIKNEWSSKGRRVLLLAHKAVSSSWIKSSPTSSGFETEMMEQARSGLTLVGLVAIVDPPREEIPAVVSTLRRAGIRIFMVSPQAPLPRLDTNTPRSPAISPSPPRPSRANAASSPTRTTSSPTPPPCPAPLPSAPKKSPRPPPPSPPPTPPPSSSPAATSSP